MHFFMGNEKCNFFPHCCIISLVKAYINSIYWVKKKTKKNICIIEPWSKLWPSWSLTLWILSRRIYGLLPVIEVISVQWRFQHMANGRATSRPVGSNRTMTFTVSSFCLFHFQLFSPKTCFCYCCCRTNMCNVINVFNCCLCLFPLYTFTYTSTYMYTL